MKKLAIASAAVALAAMPVVGVFAENVLTVKDKLVLTVSSSCTYDGITPEAATSETGNEYTASATPNQLVSFAATSSATSLTVKCNDADGYRITPTFTGLTGPTGAQSINYGSGQTEAAQGSGTWTAYYAKNSTQQNPVTPVAFTASGTAIEGTPTMTDTYTFSYKVGTLVDQAAGEYNGTATYVLAAK